MIDKMVGSAEEAVADIPSGVGLAVGGFGLCGMQSALISALLVAGTTDLEVVSDSCGVDDRGLGLLLGERRIRKIISSEVGENTEFARQLRSGVLEVELTPQGTLIEKLRAGGAGIAAFYTPVGVGTQIAFGGLARRYHPDGSRALVSEPKEVRDFDGVPFVLERSLRPDFALVHAAKGDRHGNLVFHAAALSFTQLAAVAGRTTIVEVAELVEPEELFPSEVHCPGVFVQRVVHVPVVEERIECRAATPAEWVLRERNDR